MCTQKEKLTAITSKIKLSDVLTRAAKEHLAEKLIEQGVFIADGNDGETHFVSPVKVGQTIYVVRPGNGSPIMETKVSKIVADKEGVKVYFMLTKLEHCLNVRFYNKYFFAHYVDAAHSTLEGDD